jgi:hypothetical protein
MADRDLSAVLQLAEQLQPALERQDNAQLRDIVSRLVALRAPMGDQWQQLAQIADGIGEAGLARRAIDLHVEAAGGTDAALYQKAAFLAQSGAVHEADALLRSLPDDVPNPLANAYSRGIGALNLGRTDEARAYLERVTHTRPQTGSAWLALAMATDLARDPALVARIVGAERGMERATPAEIAPYYYALGKAHADCGDHALAFAAFARGAREMSGLVRYDRAADRAGAAEAVRGYSAARIAAIAREQREPTARTIFATGLPRSGTTLIEQILTSHSAVGDGAEFSGLALLSQEVGGAAWHALASHVGERGTAPVARLWHHWLDERFASLARVVDKSIDSTRYLGLAAALLPEAPLVWTTRDPLDRAWSCFRTNFLGGAIAWSYDLEDIAFHFRLEDELLRQWQQILGDRLLVVPYEALVSDPEAGIRRILAHCGLSEEPQVFAPHANPRPVATASMVQVRRPIGREAIGSAQPYREFLAPFIEAYYR